MQYANLVFAMFLFLMMLFACTSNQSSKSTQQNFSEKSGDTQNNDNVSQKQLLSAIPANGKLQDEHLKMYVSVKIKQEQLRYQQQISRSEKKQQEDPNFQNYTDHDLEKIAINDFGFDSEIYYWSKRIIQDTLITYVASGSTSVTELTDKDVLAHNLSVLAKHKEELRFANSYRLKLNVSSSRPIVLKNGSKNLAESLPKPST